MTISGITKAEQDALEAEKRRVQASFERFEEAWRRSQIPWPVRLWRRIRWGKP